MHIYGEDTLKYQHDIPPDTIIVGDIAFQRRVPHELGRRQEPAAIPI